MDRWTFKDYLTIEELIKVYQGTIVEKVLHLKECLFQLLNNGFGLHSE